MDIQDAIARNVKSIREQKKLTLDGAARLSGVSRSMLAQIEKGDVNPTVTVLWKIANGFKVPFTSLMEDRAQTSLVIRGHASEPLAEDGGRYLNYPAFPFDADKLFETYRIEIRAGGSLEAQPHIAGTEEYITVFAGDVEIGAGQEAFQLRAGDSLRFKADRPHYYKNTGSGTVWLSMLIYYAEP